MEELVRQVSEDLDTLSSDADDAFSKYEDFCNELEGIKELAQELVELMREAGIIQPAGTLNIVEGKN